MLQRISQSACSSCSHAARKLWGSPLARRLQDKGKKPGVLLDQQAAKPDYEPFPFKHFPRIAAAQSTANATL